MVSPLPSFLLLGLWDVRKEKKRESEFFGPPSRLEIRWVLDVIMAPSTGSHSK